MYVLMDLKIEDHEKAAHIGAACSGSPLLSVYLPVLICLSLSFLHIITIIIHLLNNVEAVQDSLTVSRWVASCRVCPVALHPVASLPIFKIVHDRATIFHRHVLLIEVH